MLKGMNIHILITKFKMLYPKSSYNYNGYTVNFLIFICLILPIFNFALKNYLCKSETYVFHKEQRRCQARAIA